LILFSILTAQEMEHAMAVLSPAHIVAGCHVRCASSLGQRKTDAEFNAGVADHTGIWRVAILIRLHKVIHDLGLKRLPDIEDFDGHIEQSLQSFGPECHCRV